MPPYKGNIKSNTPIKENLGFLGDEFQKRLVKCFIEDQPFFEGLQHIIDPNMFTVDILRRIVSFMKDRYVQGGKVATYFELETLARSKISDAITIEYILSMLDEIRRGSLDGMDIIEEKTEQFFKQQNLVKAINNATEIVKNGKMEDYTKIEEIFSNALKVNLKEDLPHQLYENIEATLSEDFRQTLSTGVPELDEALGGGLGKGEVGVIIAPSNVGKAQPLHSKVLTPEGFKTMGEIKVGDMVIGGDNHPYKVSGVFPQGKRPIYKVIFSNGAQCECDIEHLWTVSLDNGNTWVVKTTEYLKSIINDAPILTPTFKDLPENTKPFYMWSIFETKSCNAQCIMVDSQEHTYVTDDYIVTHNTSMCTGFAAAAALNKCEANNEQGWKVLHYYFEDKDESIERKYYGYHLDIDAIDLSKEGIREQAIQMLSQDSDIKTFLKRNTRVQRLANMEVSVDDIERRIKRLISLGFKPDLVIVDYFECLKLEKGDTNDSLWAKQALTIRKLEALSNNLNVAIWVPVQGTKGSFNVEYVSMQQAGGAVEKVQVAHVVISLARTKEMKTHSLLNINIEKLRGTRFTRDEFKNAKFNCGTCKLDLSACDDIDLIDADPNNVTPRGIATNAGNRF